MAVWGLCTLTCLTPELVWSTSLYQLSLFLSWAFFLKGFSQQKRSVSKLSLLTNRSIHLSMHPHTTETRQYMHWATTTISCNMTYIITKNWFPPLFFSKFHNSQPWSARSFSVKLEIPRRETFSLFYNLYSAQSEILIHLNTLVKWI